MRGFSSQWLVTHRHCVNALTKAGIDLGEKRADYEQCRDESTVSYCLECKRPLVEMDQSRPSPSGVPDLQHLVVAHWWWGGQTVGGGLGGSTEVEKAD